MKPILLATDGSPSAEAATQEAIDLAGTLHTDLIVVSVADPELPVYSHSDYGPLADELQETDAERVSQVLAETRSRAVVKGVTCETVVLDGSVGEAICRFAREHDARIVVVGAHGWGRLGRLLHGSVSTHVLQHAPCPVLVVTGTASEEADAASLTSIAGGSTRS